MLGIVMLVIDSPPVQVQIHNSLGGGVKNFEKGTKILDPPEHNLGIFFI